MITKQEIEKFYADLENMGLVKPVAAMMAASGLKSSGTVSDYLSKKKKPSEKFIKAFYDKVYKPSPKALSNGLDQELPTGGVRVTLLDYIHEIQQQKDFLQELLKENMIKVAANLEIVVGKAEGLQFDLISGRETVLKSLARIEEKPVLSLLNESDKLRASLAKQADELSRKSASGK